MKKLNETPIGNLNTTTFRPTEAEKLVLLNVDDMSTQGRSVTQQDAINVPEEKMQKTEMTSDQLETAFRQLIKIGLLQVEPNQTIVVTQQGQPVVEELKKAAEQEPEEPANQEPGAGGEMGGVGAGPGMGTGGMDGLPADLGQMPMENLQLIRYLNDMSKLLG
jgi:hypothetical protein